MDSERPMSKLTLEQLLRNASEAPAPRRSAKFRAKKPQQHSSSPSSAEKPYNVLASASTTKDALSAYGDREASAKVDTLVALSCGSEGSLRPRVTLFNDTTESLLTFRHQPNDVKQDQQIRTKDAQVETGVQQQGIFPPDTGHNPIAVSEKTLNPEPQSQRQGRHHRVTDQSKSPSRTDVICLPAQQPVEEPAEPDQRNNEELTTSDEEILTLGFGYNDSQEDSQVSSSSLQSPQGLKHARDGGLSSPPDSTLMEVQISSNEDEEFPSKRQRQNWITQRRKQGKISNKQSKNIDGTRNSKQRVPKNKKVEPQKRRKVRRLPVDELIITPERLSSSEGEEQADTCSSQDPIVDTQVEGKTPTRRQKTPKREPLKDLSSVWRKNIFGLINISEYRIPKPKNLSPKSKLRTRTNPTYSEGFEGDEAKPTGRFMGLKQSSRRQSANSGVAAKLGELMLVSESIDEQVICNNGGLGPHLGMRDHVVNKKGSISRDSHVHKSLSVGNRENAVAEVYMSGGNADLPADERNLARNLEAKHFSHESCAEDASSALRSNETTNSLLSVKQDHKNRLGRAVSFNGSVDVYSQLMMVSMPRRGSGHNTEIDYTDIESSQGTENESSLSDCASMEQEEQYDISEDEAEETTNEESTVISAGANDELTASEIIENSHRWQSTRGFDTRGALEVSSSEMEAVTLRNTELNKGISLAPEGRDGTQNETRRVSTKFGLKKNNTVHKMQAMASNTIGWLKIREPSAHAFEQYRKSEFKKAQVDLDDPKAAFKLNVSATKMPGSAIKPGGWISDPQTPRKSSPTSPRRDKPSPTDPWRPRKPASGNVRIEVEEDIFDGTPTKKSSQGSEVKHRSTNVKRSFNLERSSPPSLHREEAFISRNNSLGSVILGSTQLLLPGIPESQMSYQNSVSEDSFQTCDFSNVSDRSYSQNASQQASRSPITTKSQSVPLQDYHRPAYQQISSPCQNQDFNLGMQPRPHPQIIEPPGRDKNSKNTTREVTIGTRNSRARPLPFVPPFAPHFRHTQN